MVNPNYYNYYIVFKATSVDYSSVKKVTIDSCKKENIGRQHLFDDDLIPIIPGIEYCLHLPRNEFDVLDLEFDILSHSYDTAHSIIIIPDFDFTKVKEMASPTLIICDDSIFDDISIQSNKINADLGVSKISELSNDLLINHWKKLYELRNWVRYKPVPGIDIQYILEEEKIKFLPIVFIERQFGRVLETYNKIFNSQDYDFDLLGLIREAYLREKTLSDLYKLSPKETEFSQLYKKYYMDNFKIVNLNIVITFPGIPSQQIKYGGLSNITPIVEKRIIRIMGVHRAIAKKAYMIELYESSKELFSKLNNLEIACSSEQGTNNKYVHKTIELIWEIFRKNLTIKQQGILHTANNIDVFSNFPVGIVKMDKVNVPLQLYHQVSHRPLSPLTRNLTYELVRHNQILLEKRCKILFIECVKDTKENRIIRDCSQKIIESIKFAQKNAINMNYEYVEAYTIQKIKNILTSRHLDTEIVIISAHGFYNRSQNLAGIIVGDEEWYAGDNDYYVSPIILLSACHTSPRGTGVVNAAEMFFRCGALAVLSTLVTIEAQRNAILISRLFVYIAEAQKGNNQYKNLSEAWSGIVGTNAIEEIIAGSQNLKNWFYGENNGVNRAYDFKMNRSKGRLRTAYIYEDTINIIKEMLVEEGIDSKFKNIIEGADYFPESFFYEWLGSPENVLLSLDFDKNK